MARKIILITGGQRSGKSVFAERIALSMCDAPVYVATAGIGDEEMEQRVAVHRARRGAAWTNIEEGRCLSSLTLSGETVLVDCVTMWLTNIFFANDENPERALCKFKEEFDKFTAQDATFVFVTNEIGCGGTSANAMQRAFTDALGIANIHVASAADDVYLLVSGIPVKIK